VSKFRAVLFDLGGVVFESPMAGFAHYESAAGLPDGLIRRLNATNHHSNAWARYERGEVDRAGFIRQFEAEALAAGYHVDAVRVLESLKGDVYPVMKQALVRLKSAHLKLAAVTNNVEPLASGRVDTQPFLGLFDVIVESSVEKVRKPEPEFYRLVLDRLGLEAEECVYLDDLGINLKPAREMGMTTIKVVDPESALATLQDHLGVPLLEPSSGVG